MVAASVTMPVSYGRLKRRSNLIMVLFSTGRRVTLPSSSVKTRMLSAMATA